MPFQDNLQSIGLVGWQSIYHSLIGWLMPMPIETNPGNRKGKNLIRDVHHEKK